MKASYIPLVTVGIVVLNREWVIGKMLDSLLRQSYPHNRIFVVMVDGGSKDRTIEIARKILEKSDFIGHDVVVKRCSIPEGRNMCIEKMQGDVLFSWDSDVIMQPNAIQDMVRIMMQKKVDIVDADWISIFVNSIGEADEKINEVLKSPTQPSRDSIVEAQAAGMGHTLISRNVVSSIRFDPDLTVCEDMDFSLRAREKGFKIVLVKRIIAFDINMWKKGYSDIHIDMPLKRALRGLRKKAKVQVLTYSSTLTFGDAIAFFLKNKRYLFYLGYILTFVFTLYGLLTNSYLLLVFPVYLSFFTLLQIKRRGVKLGMQAVLRSIVIGVPFSLWLIYYLSKYLLKRQRSSASAIIPV